jgi:septum formation protein
VSTKRIVLASVSPRRLDLLRATGFEVVCDPSGVAEIESGFSSPHELALVNAGLKWQAVAIRHKEILVSADTVVWGNNKFYGKPRDLIEAKLMLNELGGRTHEVVTGVVVGIPGGRVESFAESSRVTFRAIDEVFIDSYLKSINPLDKAAGYAAQGDGGRLISALEGSLTNVIGLPMERLGEVLASKFGVLPSALAAIDECRGEIIKNDGAFLDGRKN